MNFRPTENESTLQEVLAAVDAVATNIAQPFHGRWGDTINIRNPEWLWAGRILINATNIIEGDPSVGKSTLVSKIVACLTSGVPLPLDDTKPRAPMKVAWFTTEDDAETTIMPRILAANGDLSMVKVFEVMPLLATKDGSINAGDRERLRLTMMADAFQVLVLDPGNGAVPNTNDEAIVRKAHEAIYSIGQEFSVTTLWLRHLVKGGAVNRGQANPSMLGIGSVAGVGGARSVLQLHEDQHALQNGEDFNILVGHAKCNVGPRQPSIRCRIVPATVYAEDASAISTSRFEFSDELDYRSLAEALRSNANTARRAAGRNNPALEANTIASFQRTADGVVSSTTLLGIVNSTLGTNYTKLSDWPGKQRLFGKLGVTPNDGQARSYRIEEHVSRQAA